MVPTITNQYVQRFQSAANPSVVTSSHVISLMDAQMSEMLANCGSSFQKMSVTRPIDTSADSTCRSLIPLFVRSASSTVVGSVF